MRTILLAACLVAVGCGEGGTVTSPVGTSAARQCVGRMTKVDGRVGTIELLRDDYVSGTGRTDESLRFHADLGCNRGLMVLSAYWGGKGCQVSFHADEATLKEIEALITELDLCAEHREAPVRPSSSAPSASAPSLMRESEVYFERSCPEDGPSLLEVPDRGRIRVMRTPGWTSFQPGDVHSFAGGESALLAKLRSMVESRITPQCPANWADVFASGAP